jgi:glycosyltransferase involved in cell wall biosynthesis
MENRKFTICIPEINDFQNTVNSISKIIDDERIYEIVICDDHSEDIIWWHFEDWLQFDVDARRVKLCRNLMNLGEQLNKQRVVIFANSDYVLLVDSHKIIEPEDIDIIYQYTWDENIDLQLVCGRFVFRNKWLENFDKQNAKLLG